jgi:hypothetical protein
MMKTVTDLLPLALGIAIIGFVTWYLLKSDWAIGPWLLAGLLFAHGWVHLMFVFPRPAAEAAAAGGSSWPFDMSRSWLITGPGVDVGVVRAVGIILMAIAFAGFLLAALSTLGIVVPTSWWAGLVAGSAVGSLVLLTLFVSPSLALGYAIDLVLLWLVASSAWAPTTAPLG